MALGKTDWRNCKKNKLKRCHRRRKERGVVIGFKGNRIMVVTVIDKAKVFVKKGTVIELKSPDGRRSSRKD